MSTLYGKEGGGGGGGPGLPAGLRRATSPLWLQSTSPPRRARRGTRARCSARCHGENGISRACLRTCRPGRAAGDARSQEQRGRMLEGRDAQPEMQDHKNKEEECLRGGTRSRRCKITRTKRKNA